MYDNDGAQRREGMHKDEDERGKEDQEEDD